MVCHADKNLRSGVKRWQLCVHVVCALSRGQHETPYPTSPCFFAKRLSKQQHCFAHIHHFSLLWPHPRALHLGKIVPAVSEPREPKSQVLSINLDTSKNQEKKKQRIVVISFTVGTVPVRHPTKILLRPTTLGRFGFFFCRFCHFMFKNKNQDVGEVFLVQMDVGRFFISQI